MPQNHRIVYNGQDTGTLNLDTLVAGTTTGGPTLVMHNVEKDTLSVLAVVEAETDTLTIEGQWQVSNDASTWVDVMPSNAAADVVLATGTAGGDPVVTVCLVAPKALYGWRYGRFAVINLVATGNAVDTYRIGYNYENALVG